MKENHYDVAIVGGGISGTSLLFMLSKYSNIKSLALVEKYESLSPLNSRASANSQTIHSGDIETNYTFEKAKKVKKAADMTVKYCLNHGYENKIMFQTQKMAMGVGDEECEYIKKRFDEFKELYPYLEFYDKEVLKEIEPSVVFDKNGSERSENVVAMGVKTGVYTTADYGAMSVSLVNNAKKEGKICDIYLNSRVTKISKMGDEYYLQTTGGESISADFVVVNAGAHSLYLAHKMGYGKDLGTAIIAGSFYFTKQKMLNGKVYMVQNPKLPFAALHGDPDILKGGLTRFGPTALLLPLLERYRGLKSFPEAISAMNLDSQAIKFFYGLLKDREIRNYLARNVLFEVPKLNKKLFVKDAKKIIPSISVDDIYYAKGFGGARPQIFDKKTAKLFLGEASINENDGIIFNMTPSPGATSAISNAKKDALSVCEYLGVEFLSEKFVKDFDDE